MQAVNLTLGKRLVLIALGGAIWLGLYVHAPAAPILAPDSGTYLHFAATRTAGYPLFLVAFGARGALILQPILAAAALTYLGWEMALLTGSLLSALVLMLLCCANPPLLAFHYTILTESLFVSLLMVLLGKFMRLAQRPSLTAAAAASTVAGFAIAVRPVGWFLFPLMPMIALLLRRGTFGAAHEKPLLLVTALTLPLLAVALGERELSALWHDAQASSTQTASLLGINLVGKAGMLDGPPSDSSHEAQAFAVGFKPVRQLIASAPDWAIGRFLEIKYETCLEYACGPAIGLDPASPAMRRAAFARIRANPVQFVHLTWEHYKSLWTIYSITTPDERSRLDKFFASHKSLPFEKLVPDLRARFKPAPPIARFAQLALAGIAVMAGWLAAGGVVAAIVTVRLSPALITAVVAALVIEGDFALTALIGHFEGRYMLVMWPAMIVMLTSSIFCLLAFTPTEWRVGTPPS